MNPLLALAVDGMNLENAVLAPYLCAMWSIHDGTNTEARTLLRAVAMEEMLHLAQAANLVWALGGEPRLARTCLAPLPFTPGALRRFCALEAPEGSPDAHGPHRTEDRYRALASGLREAVASLGAARVFRGDPARQLSPALYYGGRGTLIPVTDLGSALAAIDLLLDQTGGRQGLDPAREGEPATDCHHRRFVALLAGRRFDPGDTDRPTGEPIGVDWEAVCRFEGAWAEDPEIRRAQEDFAAEWEVLVANVEAMLLGTAGIGASAGRMCSLGPAAQRLMRLPGRRPGWGAGPVLGEAWS